MPDLPESAEAINNRGNQKRIRGDLDGALADFSLALELKPGLAAAYCNRGKCPVAANRLFR